MTYLQMNDIPLTGLEASKVEEGNPLTLAFRNDDVSQLSWQDLSVTVPDRVTGEDRILLSNISGHVQAGT